MQYENREIFKWFNRWCLWRIKYLEYIYVSLVQRNPCKKTPESIVWPRTRLFIYIYFIFQCINGHLMCCGCFNHLLADARLKDETATCPNCRCEISKNSCTRNLAVEKAVSELPSLCQFCSLELPRNSLEYHERELCQERWELLIPGKWP